MIGATLPSISMTQIHGQDLAEHLEELQVVLMTLVSAAGSRHTTDFYGLTFISGRIMTLMKTLTITRFSF